MLHRAGKEGLGAAYLAGFALGPGRAATTSSSRWTPTARTSPSSCPALLAAARGRRPRHRLPLGPRRLGASTGRCTARRSRVGGNLYTRVLLGMPVNDATAGFRAYRTDALRTMGLDDVASQGYCFQVDLTWRAVRPGLRVRRGADHVRRARGRRLQDEPGHHARVAAADHPLGRAAPRRPAARLSGGTGSRRGTACERQPAPPRTRRRRRPRGAALWSSCSCSSSRSSRSRRSSRSARSSAAGRPCSCSCWSRCSAPGWSGARAPAPGPRCRTALRTGRMPSRQLADAALVLVGGTLLLTPGFVTDIVGFFFILPLTRPLARAWPRGRGRPGCSARGHVRPGRTEAAARGEAARHHRGRGPLTSLGTACGADRADCGQPRPRHTGHDEGRVPIGDAAFRSLIGSGGLALAARLLAAGLAQQGQALLEELLELGDGATLEQHVPVGARRA